MEKIMTRAEYDITEYGAIPSDDKPDTTAIQSAIDTCAKTGGGVVRIPAGAFLSGVLVIRDIFTSHLDAEAVLRGSNNYLNYGEGK
jgi:DNA sulfur modification protein DndE